MDTCFHETPILTAKAVLRPQRARCIGDNQTLRLLKELFENNEKWASGSVARDPGFFERLVHQQAPQFFWIGCSDSRVPANEIVGLLPGEVFVHRNVANLVNASDVNCLSAMQYAVEILKVRHILVVGHYGCGGVKAALEDRALTGYVGEWLEPLRAIRNEHGANLTWDRLCELNVVAQVRAACQTSVVQQAWRRGQQVAVHGWIYHLHDGRLKDLNVTVTCDAEVRSLSHHQSA